MKYTMSFDGVERCTVKVPLRFTREEYRILTGLARDLGKGYSLRDYLAGVASADFKDTVLEEQERMREEAR
jgi:hypothetical protein